MKKLCVFLLMLFSVFSIGCGNNASDTPKHEDTKSEIKEEKPIVYDKLQNLFAQLNFNVRADDIENYVAANNLEYTKEKYHVDEIKYKIALTPTDAKQRYGTSGDNVEITFNKGGNFLYAEYVKSTSSMIAILYNYGTYWDFNEKSPNNKYSGYYYHKPGDMSEDGTEIRYSNGYRKKTSYYRVSDANNALIAVLKPLK